MPPSSLLKSDVNSSKILRVSFRTRNMSQINVMIGLCGEGRGLHCVVTVCFDISPKRRRKALLQAATTEGDKPPQKRENLLKRETVTLRVTNRCECVTSYQNNALRFGKMCMHFQ